MQRYHMAQNQFGNYFMCGPNGADGNNDSQFVLESDAQARIAAKDAELQKANYLLARREKLIKKLGKKVQRLESANAGLRELLKHSGEMHAARADWIESTVHDWNDQDDNIHSGTRSARRDMFRSSIGDERAIAARIDVALKKAGVRE